jgi:hypothetical protein
MLSGWRPSAFVVRRVIMTAGGHRVTVGFCRRQLAVEAVTVVFSIAWLKDAV